jgi:copper(I)-binding protein
MTAYRTALFVCAAVLAACSQETPETAQDMATEDHAGMTAPAAVDDSAAPDISVQSGWVRATPGGNDVTAAYFTLANSGGADRLLGASSDQIGRVELHASMQDEAGVMRMERLPGVDVPAGGEAVFAPGGNHLMLFGAADLSFGDTLCLTLDFERSEDRISCLPVMDEAPLD